MSEIADLLGDIRIIKCLKGGMPSMNVTPADHIFPVMDVFGNSECLRIYADLPGVAKDDVSIYIYEGYIVIEGMKKVRKVSDDYRFLRLETDKLAFRRIVRLPFHVSECKSALIDGVLTVFLQAD